jgi:divalent metal cation (Fe/Co/Zn/Cd) transporter
VLVALWWSEQVRKLALEVAGVRGIEKLFIRKSGLEYFVDIHVEVTPKSVSEKSIKSVML